MTLLMTAQLLALFKGLATSAGLIVAIGAQNAFVLTQGLRREYHWPIAGICSFFDALFITLGIAGMGALVSESPTLLSITQWGGALFLGWYGLRSFRAAFQDNSLKSESRGIRNLTHAILTTLAITLLNPHVYLDTLGLIGAISVQFTTAALKSIFAIGAVTSSFVFFFGLGYGARLLAPVMQSAKAWQILDVLIGLVMWALAFKLLS